MSVVYEEKQLKQSRMFYILYAAVEYLIALAVSGSFLAKLTTEIGMSDGMTGVISAVGTLGGLFQLISMFIHKSRVKRMVLVLTAANQLLFISLYLIPQLALGQQVSGVLFTLSIVMANLLINAAAPKKSTWMMSLVDDRRRGVFSAYKEMFSLALGMAFSFGMGALFDWLEGMGRLYTAFGIMACVMIVCMLLSVMCQVVMVEKPLPVVERKPILQIVQGILRNKRLRSVVLLYLLYFLINNSAIPFFATYQLNELGFSLTLISSFGILSSVARLIVSPYWGRLADRLSFAAMLEKCFLVLGGAFLFAALAVPSNGKIMFALYYIFHGIAMGGVNSGMFNLVFDCAVPEERADALAVCQSISGLSGFLITLVFSTVVTALQQGGNQLFGMTVYAQQALSVVSLLVTLGAVAYVHFHVQKSA